MEPSVIQVYKNTILIRDMMFELTFINLAFIL